MLYGLRHIVTTVFISLRYLDDDFLRLLTDWRLCVTDALALIVLFSVGHRVAEARPAMRKIWHAGRHLLLAAYALELLLFSSVHWHELAKTTSYLHNTILIYCIVNSAIIVYLAKSKLVVDVFADFPEQTDMVTKRPASK